MRVTIPDDLADALQAKLTPAQTLDGEVTRLLTACSGVPAGSQVLVLDAHRLNELAALMGRPSLLSYTDLVATIERLGSLSFGALRLQFSPGQLEELQHRAAREGMPVEEYTARILRSWTSNFFTTAPARDQWGQVTQGDPPPPADETIEILA
jgi:hypothetical protein